MMTSFPSVVKVSLINLPPSQRRTACHNYLKSLQTLIRVSLHKRLKTTPQHQFHRHGGRILLRFKMKINQISLISKITNIHPPVLVLLRRSRPRQWHVFPEGILEHMLRLLALVARGMMVSWEKRPLPGNVKRANYQRRLVTLYQMMVIEVSIVVN